MYIQQNKTILIVEFQGIDEGTLSRFSLLCALAAKFLSSRRYKENLVGRRTIAFKALAPRILALGTLALTILAIRTLAHETLAHRLI